MKNRTSLFTPTDLLLLLMITLWAVNYSVIKTVISTDLRPIVFTALRFGVAALTLIPLLRSMSRDERLAARADWWKIIGVGLLGNTLYQVFFISGIDYTSPTNSALILAGAPIFVAVFGALLKIEKLNWLAWLGIIVSFIGIGIVIVGNAPAEAIEPGKSSVIGDLLVLAGTMVWAAYTVAVAPLLKRHSAPNLTAMSVTIGTIPLLLLAAPAFVATNWTAVSFSSWLGVAYSGVLVIAVGYLIWNRGVQEVGGTRTAVYSNLTPVITAVVAYLARGDALTIYHAIGAVVILGGIVLTRIARRQSVSLSNPHPMLTAEDAKNS